jgi:hypothetical protein
MADLKISQLTALDSGDVASTDVLAVVDVSATQTKKITATDLATYVNGLAPAGVTTLDGLDDVTITSVSAENCWRTTVQRGLIVRLWRSTLLKPQYSVGNDLTTY